MKTTMTFSFRKLAVLWLCTALSGCGGGDNGGGNGGIAPPPIVTDDYRHAKPSAATIRLLTYNAFYCKSNSGTPAFNETNTKNFADVIRSLDADIVAVQELDSGTTSRGKRHLLDDIRRSTGIDYEMVYGPAADYDNGSIGCGLLVRKTLPIRKIEKVPLPGNEKRMLLIAHLDRFVVMGTHLDLDAQARRLSAETIVEYARKQDKPVFLAGDLNDSPAWPSASSAFPTLNGHFTVMSATDGNLSTNIDFVLLSTAHTARFVKKGSSYVKRLSIDGQVKDLSTVSDHYPVFLDVETAP